jgi:hypothetical protein
MNTETTEQLYFVSAPARLEIKNIRGSVTIRGVDGANSIHITAIKHLDSGDAQRTEIQMSQLADGSVSVQTRYQESGWLLSLLGAHWPCKVDYTVEGPADCTLRVEGVSNTALIEGLKGSLSLKSVSGEIEARRLEGTISLHTISGDIGGDQLSGALTVDTTSGRVRLEASDFSSLQANSVSGVLFFKTPLSTGPYTFKTISGDIRLVVPAKSACNVDFQSISGRFSSNLPAVTGQQRQRGSQSAAVQGGGPMVKFNTVSGNASLETDGEVATQPPAPSAPEPATPQAATPQEALSTREILDQIAEGKLTVDEGLNLIKGE